MARVAKFGTSFSFLGHLLFDIVTVKNLPQKNNTIIPLVYIYVMGLIYK